MRACASGLYDALMIQHAILDQRAEVGKTHFVRREDEPSHVAGIDDPPPHD